MRVRWAVLTALALLALVVVFVRSCGVRDVSELTDVARPDVGTPLPTADLHGPVRGSPPDPASPATTAEPGPTAPGVVLSGRLLDEDTGSPVVGGRVWLLSAPGAVPNSPPDPSSMGVSDTEGRFALTLPASTGAGGEEALVGALAHGYASACVTVATGAPCVIRLAAGGQIDGVVLDERDAPVRGARVEARAWYGDEVQDPERADRPPFLVAVAPDYGWDTTREDGTFRVRGLAGASIGYRMSFRSATHAMDESTGWPSRVEATRVGQSVTLRARTIYGVRVLLVDANSGQPVRGASVSYESGKSDLTGNYDAQCRDWRDPQHLRGILTDGVQGSIGVARGRTLGPLTVVATAPGYEEERVEIQPDPSPWPVHRIPLRKAPGADVREIRVEARFAGGAGFTGPLSISASDPAGNRDLFVVTLNFRDGRAEDTLPIDANLGPCLLTARGAGLSGIVWAGSGESVVVDPAHVDAIRFELKGTLLSVRVRDENGHSLRGYDLNLQAPSAIAILDTLRSDRMEPGYVGADGTWRCWLQPGRTTVVVSKIGFANVRRDVDATDAGGEVALDLVLLGSPR